MMQTMKTTLNQKLTPKTEGIVTFGTAAFFAALAVGALLVPGVTNGQPITALIPAALAGGFAHRAYALLSGKLN